MEARVEARVEARAEARNVRNRQVPAEARDSFFQPTPAEAAARRAVEVAEVAAEGT